MIDKHWWETDEGKESLLGIINGLFTFDRLGNIYCRECKNETIDCVCMRDE